MGKLHKHENQSITVTTKLDPSQLEGLARRAAEKRSGSGASAAMTGLQNSGQKAEVIGAGPAAILLKVGAPMNANLMKFSLLMTNQDGKVTVKSDIESYKTNRQTFMFIPITPTNMIAFDAYKAFCRRFVDAVKAEDPTAVATSTMW